MKSSRDVSAVKSMAPFELQLCDIQGRLYELAIRKGYDSVDFSTKFVRSATAEFLDLPYDRLQWAGEEYILADLLAETPVAMVDAPTFTDEEAFWIGYTYRYWHLFTGENSREIEAQADAVTMMECYMGFHTLDVAMAIENLKELYRQRSQVEKTGEQDVLDKDV